MPLADRRTHAAIAPRTYRGQQCPFCKTNLPIQPGLSGKLGQAPFFSYRELKISSRDARISAFIGACRYEPCNTPRAALHLDACSVNQLLLSLAQLPRPKIAVITAQGLNLGIKLARTHHAANDGELIGRHIGGLQRGNAAFNVVQGNSPPG